MAQNFFTLVVLVPSITVSSICFIFLIVGVVRLCLRCRQGYNLGYEISHALGQSSNLPECVPMAAATQANPQQANYQNLP
jgi:hypothetical protein